MPDPRNRDLSRLEFGKDGMAILTGSRREQGFPYQFPEKSARFEMFGGRQVLERTRESFSWRRWTGGVSFRHRATLVYHEPPFGQISNYHRQLSRAHDRFLLTD